MTSSNFRAIKLLLIATSFGVGCGKTTTTHPMDVPDASDTDSDTDSDSVEDAGQDTDTSPEDGGIDAGYDAGKEPGGAGDPCWTEILKKWHPNYGLPDCTEGYRCIGDADEAWCTERCAATGTTNNDGGGLDGFCCGELTSPCSPQRYWLPASMNFFCIPLIAPLGGQCDLTTEWTGENKRCAPICDGDELIQNTQCAQYEGGTFCTYQCDPGNGDKDCVIEPAFEGGCCGEILGGTWCLIPELCTSSTI